MHKLHLQRFGDHDALFRSVPGKIMGIIMMAAVVGHLFFANFVAARFRDACHVDDGWDISARKCFKPTMKVVAWLVLFAGPMQVRQRQIA